VADAASDAVVARSMPEPPHLRLSATGLQTYARHLLDAAVAYPKARLTRRDLRLARADVAAWFTSPELATLCERTLVARTSDDAPATRVELYAMDAEADGWALPAVWADPAGFSSREFEQILAGRDLRGFYYHDGPAWQLYDRTTRIGVQALSTPLGMAPWESTSPLRLFLHWAYAAAGMRLAHAATLAADGRGALIVGPSGSGKSSTMLAGLVHGLDSVGDDYVLVDPGPSVTAYALFTVLKQDREGLRRAGISAVEAEAQPLNWRGKVEVEAVRYSRKGLVDRMEVTALLIPEIAHARRTTVEKVTAHEAALALAPSGVFQLPGDTAEGFRLLADVARRLPAFRVKLSEDAADIAGAIGGFLTGGGTRAD
jgi:hypothetical protein